MHDELEIWMLHTGLCNIIKKNSSKDIHITIFTMELGSVHRIGRLFTILLWMIEVQRCLDQWFTSNNTRPFVWSPIPGAVLVDQYCNPLAEITLESISAQIEEITDKVKKCLRVKNATHPSLRASQGQFARRDPENSIYYSHEVY